MESYEFTLELSRDIIDSEAEKIKASCSDATIRYIPTGIDTGYTGTLVEFGREAETLEKAIESAMRDVEVAPDLRATGITIPAPERSESASEETGSGTEASGPEAPGTEAEPAEARTEAEPAEAKKKPSVKKTSTRKSGTRKTGTRNAVAD